MARNHGRLMSSIWRDEDWRALPRGPQATYTMLLSQSDLGHCGLVSLAARRWARYTNGLTDDEIMADLRYLERHGRFVVVDEDTEEVLVRSLIRNDGVWKSPNVMRAAAENVREIESPKLRAALLDELHRLPLDELSGEPSRKGSPTTREQVTDVVDALVKALREGLADGFPEGFGEGFPEGFDPPVGGKPVDNPLAVASVQVTAPREGPPEGFREGFPIGFTKPPTRVRAPVFPLPLPLPLPQNQDARGETSKTHDPPGDPRVVDTSWLWTMP